MSEQGRVLVDDKIADEERLGRIVLSPRDIDSETGYPKENFITLRLNEDGISFLRIDYLGEEIFLQKCKDDGDVVRGIVTDALVLDLMDEIFHRLKYKQASLE